MYFDPLPNPEAADTLEQITPDYLRDPATLLATLDTDVRAAADAAVAASERMDAIRADVRSGAQACNAALTDAAEALPVSRTIFRERVEAAHFDRFCRAMADMETGHRALQKSLLDYARVGEDLRECYVNAFAVKRRVYAAKRAARDPSDEAAFADLAEHLRQLRVRCEALEGELRTLREETGRLCFDTLARFFDALRVRADLDGDGAACDSGAVRALCVELGQALKPFL